MNKKEYWKRKHEEEQAAKVAAYTPEQVARILKYYAGGMSLEVLPEICGGSRSSIKTVCTNILRPEDK